MGGGRKEPVKVVIINTQYVETDEVSFKSVVQSLTGKDSTAAEAAEAQPERLRSENGYSGYKKGPALNRGMSYKDLDRMLARLPPLDELYRLYSED